MNPLTLINSDGGLYVDSRDVAQAIEKNHSDLLRTIHSYCEILSESNFALADFFVEGEYEDAQGKPRPCYLITRKGCDMIANKLTGKKGVLFTAAYVTAFEKMTEQLTTTGTQFFPPKATSVGEVASIIKTLQSIMKHQNSHPVKIAVMAEGLCHQFGINIPDDFVERSPWEQMSLTDGEE